MMNTLVSSQPTQSVDITSNTSAMPSQTAKPQEIDSHLVLPTWSRLLPAMILFSNWGLLLWLGTFLESIVAQLILLPLSMLGVAIAWGWHRD